MNIAGLQLIDGYRIMRATSRRHIIVRLMTPPTNPSSAGRNKAKRMMSTTEIYALRTAYDRRRLVWINYQRHAEFFFSLSLPTVAGRRFKMHRRSLNAEPEAGGARAHVDDDAPSISASTFYGRFGNAMVASGPLRFHSATERSAGRTGDLQCSL